MRKLFLILLTLGPAYACGGDPTGPSTEFEVVGKWEAYGAGRYLFEFELVRGRFEGTGRVRGAVAYGPKHTAEVSASGRVLTVTLEANGGTLQFVGEADVDGNRINGWGISTVGPHEVPASRAEMTLVRSQ